MTIFSLPGALLNILFGLSHLIFVNPLGSKYGDPCSTKTKMEASRGRITWPGSDSWSLAEDSKSSLSDSEDCALTTRQLQYLNTQRQIEKYGRKPEWGNIKGIFHRLNTRLYSLNLDTGFYWLFLSFLSICNLAICLCLPFMTCPSSISPLRPSLSAPWLDQWQACGPGAARQSPLDRPDVDTEGEKRPDPSESVSANGCLTWNCPESLSLCSERRLAHSWDQQRPDNGLKKWVTWYLRPESQLR